MKKWLISLVSALVILGSTAAPAFADVIHASGTSGQPIAMGSNPGSGTGQAHRSSTGTTNKFTHDGWMWMD